MLCLFQKHEAGFKRKEREGPTGDYRTNVEGVKSGPLGEWTYDRDGGASKGKNFNYMDWVIIFFHMLVHTIHFRFSITCGKM